MAKIPMPKPLVPRSSGYTVAPPPKRADAELLTNAARAWAKRVCNRAGWQCEWIENGQRCQASRANGKAVAADHIHERADGGALHDDANGQCLCVQHNTLKGVRARAVRAGRVGG